MRNFEADRLVRIGDVLDILEKYEGGSEYFDLKQVEWELLTITKGVEDA